MVSSLLCGSLLLALLVSAGGAEGVLWKPGGQRVCIDGITFDSTIHCGNGHNFQRIGKDHYRFRARVGREPYAWRFYFKIECPQAVGREITLEVADFNHAGRTVFNEGATVWSTDDQRWQTLEPERMEIVAATPTGRAELDAKYGDRSHIPYGVRYRLRLAGPQMWFAVPTPYTLQRRDQLLDRLASAHTNLVSLITVGQTRHSATHGHAIRAVRITAPKENPQRQNIVVIAGEHSAESAGMYACEGWMEEVLAHCEWLDRYAFYFVPIVNVDGVYYGSSYYNLPATLREGAGENVSTGWRERRLPEVKALWPLLTEWRPVFFASLHNGRHRTAMEAHGPSSSGTDALLATWRRELGLPVDRVVARKGDYAWNVLSESGITPLAYTIETLLLVRQQGCVSFQESYIQTGRQLARGTVAALDARSTGPQAKPLQLAAADFTAQLPWFYHGLAFDRWQPHDIYSFEANALELPRGDYSVALLPAENVKSLAVSFDGTRFTDVAVRDGRAELSQVHITNRMLSFYVKARLKSVLIYPVGKSDAPKYRRDIRLAEREILQRESWDEFHTLLRRESFGKKQLRAMFNDLLAWCERRQVLDKADVHHGAIYSEEDKYDFRDALAAAVCFTYAWRDTGEAKWRQRAIAARNYALKGQHIEDATNRNQYGGFCQMGAGGVDRLSTGSFQRLGDKLPNVTGVETCIAINHLARTFELGLEPREEDLRRLELAAGWVAANEFQPGVFRHHEGSTNDCQNSTMLGAMALARAHDVLEKRGRHPPQSWLDAAQRGMRHYIEGQEAIGCWPYVFASIGRGQAFREHNIPDQGMGVYHFMVACNTPAFRSQPGVEDRMERAAKWWLCMSRIDRRGPMPTIDLDDRKTTGSLKFSAFTWCRFMAAASLLRIAEHTAQPE
ncbi:MAG: hypothetical protein FJ395_21170, partial [Verrucomicrobia bacterium]|nr:hypothetical protein [Verrucomicrobiota bacterium]